MQLRTVNTCQRSGSTCASRSIHRLGRPMCAAFDNSNGWSSEFSTLRHRPKGPLVLTSLGIPGIKKDTNGQTMIPKKRVQKICPSGLENMCPKQMEDIVSPAMPLLIHFNYAITVCQLFWMHLHEQIGIFLTSFCSLNKGAGGQCSAGLTKNAMYNNKGRVQMRAPHRFTQLPIMQLLNISFLFSGNHPCHFPIAWPPSYSHALWNDPICKFWASSPIRP